MGNMDQKVSTLNISALTEIGKALIACGTQLVKVAEAEAKIWNTEFEAAVPEPTPEQQKQIEEISKQPIKPAKITFEELRQALADMSANGFKTEAKTVLKNQGAVKLSDIKEDDEKIAAAYVEAQKILKR